MERLLDFLINSELNDSAIFNTLLGVILTSIFTIVGISFTIIRESRIRKEDFIKSIQPHLKIEIRVSRENETDAKDLTFMYTPNGHHVGDVCKRWEYAFTNVYFDITNVSNSPCTYLNFDIMRTDNHKGSHYINKSYNVVSPNEKITFKLPYYYKNDLSIDSENLIVRNGNETQDGIFQPEFLNKRVKSNSQLWYGDIHGTLYTQKIEFELQVMADFVTQEAKLDLYSYDIKFSEVHLKKNIKKEFSNGFKKYIPKRKFYQKVIDKYKLKDKKISILKNKGSSQTMVLAG